MGEGVQLWGWDYVALPVIAEWHKVRVDAAGDLQVDVLSSALPALAATAANQVLINANLATLVTEQGRCYGWDTTNWIEMEFEAVDVPNLRVKLYDGANGIDSDLFDGATVAVTARGQDVIAAIYGWDTAISRPVLVDAAGRLQIDVVSSALPALAATAANQVLINANLATLVTEQGRCYGFDGENWYPLLVEHSDQANLRVTIFDGPQQAICVPVDTPTLASGANYRLATQSVLYLWDQAAWNYAWKNAARTADANNGAFFPCVGLMGYDGANWDRLRTYGTGILKVAKGAIAPTRIRMTATGRVGVAGAKKVFWIACSPDGPSAEWEIADADAGGGTVVYDHFDTDKHSDHIDFDPPMEFTTGIWVEKYDHMKSLVFCYI